MIALASNRLRHFRFSIATAGRNLMKLDKKQVLYLVCVLRANPWSTDVAALASEWMADIFKFCSTIATIQWNLMNLTGGKYLTSSTNFVFWGQVINKDGSPGTWFTETFLTSPLQPMNENSMKLDRKLVVKYSTKFYFWSIHLQILKMAILASIMILRDIFKFSSATSGENLVKLDRKLSKTSTSSTKFCYAQSANIGGLWYSGACYCTL